jgi:hypothetical protein
MKKHGREQALAVMAVVLALLAAACGAAPAPPPSTPTPSPTEAQTSEVQVGVEEDLLGTWQVEGTAGDAVILNFFKGRFFSTFAGNEGLDRGFFVVKDKQLIFSTDLETCHFCKGSYQAYVTRQGGQPVRLRFVLNGQDPNAARTSALNGKTAVLMPGALPGEDPVSTVEDVAGIWLAESDPKPIWLACDNGQYKFHFQTEIHDSGTLAVKDGKLVFNSNTAAIGAGSYIAFVTRQAGQPAWLRFISIGDDVTPGREQILVGNIARLQMTLQPGEAPIGTLAEVVGTWIAQTNEGPARVMFENDGHYRIQIGGDFFDRGTAFIVGGRFTLRTEAPDSQASGSYMVYGKKQAGQVAQLRFVLMSEENLGRRAYFDQKTYQPAR